MKNSTINVGDYIVLQKQNYRKLLKFNKPNLSATVGKHSINLNGIEGCPYFSLFKMTSSSNKRNREYVLEMTSEKIHLKDEIEVKTSGNDNRNIVDDGRSQKLTSAEIAELKEDSTKASDIVESLIINSNTFHNKTEFSQEKYLRKKEKKYSEYIQILRPNLRLITEIMYKLDPGKIQGIRLDTLSQIITMSNIQSEGNYLSYDSGSNGLLAAALLSAIGQQTSGKLVHMHPGNMSQKQALLAMNFNVEQLERCISVNVYSVLRQFYQGCDADDNSNIEENTLKRKAETDIENKRKVAKLDVDSTCNDQAECTITKVEIEPEPKKPKWHFDNKEAAALLKEKMDGLVIACKEDPKNIFNELVEFVKPGRPFVIYYSVAEPLQQLYISLRSQRNVAALKLTCNWLRNYQVLPERTHPEVTMNADGGFLLSGYVLK